MTGGRPGLERLDGRQLFEGLRPQAEADDGDDHDKRCEGGSQASGEDFAIGAAVAVKLVTLARSSGIVVLGEFGGGVAVLVDGTVDCGRGGGLVGVSGGGMGGEEKVVYLPRHMGRTSQCHCCGEGGGQNTFRWQGCRASQRRVRGGRGGG